jgi:HK97 family phage prohead protease
LETAHLLAPFEFKLAGASADAMTFSGYGAVFGNVDSYGDVIEMGAFAAWLGDVETGKQRRPAMLSQHGGIGMNAEDLVPVGVWTSLTEDSHGLKVAGKLADTQRGREIHTLMKMGALDGLSIGYVARDSAPGTKPGERRRLKRIDVMEISPVTFPANTRALVSAVKAAGRPSNIRDFEDSLREQLGFSKLEAKKIASLSWSSLSHRDDDAGDWSQLAESLRRNIEILS